MERHMTETEFLGKMGNRYYNKSKMVSLIADRGYYSFNTAIKEVLNLKNQTVSNKMKNGSFTWEETFKLAEAFRMNLYEYWAVYLSGLFDSDGKLITHNGYMVLPDRSGIGFDPDKRIEYDKIEFE